MKAPMSRRRPLLTALLALACGAAPAAAEDKVKKPGDDSIDSLLDGNAPGAAKTPPAKRGPHESPPVEANPVAAPAPTAVAVQKAPAKPVEVAPVTDDNDNAGEAVRPKALEAVRPAAQPRRPGPYEMGPLDCRMLDGAGIERLLPPKFIAGEEPDLLCRIVVTQPATVTTAPHALTVTVNVGANATYQQKRNVRVSSIGRRALVFVIPADRISSEDLARVVVRADLSAPANPASRTIKFNVEPAD